MKKLLLTAALIAPLSVALAADPYNTDYLTVYGGEFDVLRHKNTAAQFGLEYRFSAMEYGLRPMIGTNYSNDNSFYGYVGLDWDIPLMQRQLYIIPNFAVGGYKKGDGRDLGGTVEFRSGIEVAYQFSNAHRLGIAFNHISNASIYDHNPGAESLLATYSFPINTLGQLK